MTIAVECPGCGRTSAISAEFAGRELTCPECKQTFATAAPAPPVQPFVAPLVGVYLLFVLARPFAGAAIGAVCGGVLLIVLIRCEADPQYFTFTYPPPRPGGTHARVGSDHVTPSPSSQLRLNIRIVFIPVYSRIDDSTSVIRDVAGMSLLTFLFGAGLGGYCGWVWAGGWPSALRRS